MIIGKKKAIYLLPAALAAGIALVVLEATFRIDHALGFALGALILVAVVARLAVIALK